MASTTLQDVKDLISGTIRNDQVQAQFLLGSAVYPGEGECKGCRGGDITKTTTLGPADKVVERLQAAQGGREAGQGQGLTACADGS